MAEDQEQPDYASVLAAYRQILEQRYSEVSSAYDKTLVTLSGGALAVSFAFVKDIVPNPDPASVSLLWYSWLSFGASLACILVSLLGSQYAVRRAISQVDANTIHSDRPGGVLSTVTHVLTIAGAVLFLSGVVLLASFARHNLGG